MIMRRSLGGVLAALLGSGALTVATAVPAAHAVPTRSAPGLVRATDLKADLDAILADERLAGAAVGVLVSDAGTGEVAYSRAPAAGVMPASNNKIHTSVAALALLGPGYRFHTGVYARNVRGSTVYGDLYLRGTGDATMRAAEYDRLAARVAERGITRVTGDLIADDTWFDAQRTSPDWDPTDFPFAYAAQISALTISPDDQFNSGTVKVTVTPGEQGAPVRVALTPATDVVKIDNRAVTGAAGSPSTLRIDRPAGANTLVITGSHPSGGAAVEALRTVEEPALYAADVFRKALEARGVRVHGTTSPGRTPAGAKRLAARSSMPLSRLMTPFLKLSNNMMAEILVKAIGREKRGEGGWDAGLPVIEKYLAGQGVPASRLHMTDGSGLARSNRTTPLDLATVLRKAQSKSWFPAWYHALPVAGDPDPMVGGTLASRMAGTPAAGNVHAKTGTLTGATALSGYVRDPSGRRLVFSVVFNGYQGGAPKDIEDRIAIRLAGGPASDRTVIARRVPAGAQNLECSWTMSC
ncbi:D-alanyl-D-alanine carboxypeptidase/D-alanyl-D-alanine-endopeptidase [Actinomadura sp. SCN-SB]|uniref:D-alanyl-D-alanine carboxypeptidase/D-alanyl-D-alanine endopeptidase n=1 Tax=Actinomadura sp. SCN-SB TaxID=3373092 RepID=UPI003751565B